MNEVGALPFLSKKEKFEENEEDMHENRGG
jgi:hypothetical protein